MRYVGWHEVALKRAILKSLDTWLTDRMDAVRGIFFPFCFTRKKIGFNGLRKYFRERGKRLLNGWVRA